MSGQVASAPSASTAKIRLDSIDLVRGAVMILMALDHARHFFTSPTVEPLDLTATTPVLFATRWVTHFCAPVFSFLAGTGAFLAGTRGKPKRELSWFLFTRGIWLILLEVTVVHCGFEGPSLRVGLITLWALGGSMIVLSALVFLPSWAIGSLALVIIAGHNALDNIKDGVLWHVLHTPGPIAPGVFVGYPLLPWIGVMAAGYACGELFVLPPERRRRLLIGLGISMVIAFVILRAGNFYGNPAPWSVQSRPAYSFMSFINTEKYPPSLLYLLMTLGPSLIALGLLDGVRVSRANFVVVFGRVPMFFYLLHLYVLHVPAWLWFGRKYGTKVLWFGFGSTPPDYGVSLGVAYLVWIGGVLALYPLCKWYAEVKRRSKNPWLSYL
jgi:uncharacterized membrane protein